MASTHPTPAAVLWTSHVAPATAPAPPLPPPDTQSHPDGHIPRPPNAWMLYRKAQRVLLKAENPHIHEKVVSRRVAVMWEREPPAVRDRYQRDADRAKEEHARRFPGYKYAPVRKEERMRQKAAAKAVRDHARAEEKARLERERAAAKAAGEQARAQGKQVQAQEKEAQAWTMRTGHQQAGGPPPSPANVAQARPHPPAPGGMAVDVAGPSVDIESMPYTLHDPLQPSAVESKSSHAGQVASDDLYFSAYESLQYDFAEDILAPISTTGVPASLYNACEEDDEPIVYSDSFRCLDASSDYDNDDATLSTTVTVGGLVFLRLAKLSTSVVHFVRPRQPSAVEH